MDALLWIWVAVAVAVVAVALVVFRLYRRRRLERRFGPEYDRAVERSDSRREAEAALREREERRDDLMLVPLTADARARFEARWKELQSQFVDAPAASVRAADVLIIEVMRTRGYPAEDFEQRAADLSVDHPELVDRYRSAHDVATRERAATEQQRQAVRDYRELFERLVAAAAEPEATTPESPQEEVRR